MDEIAVRQHIEAFKESSASLFLVLLVSADLSFIAVHVLADLTPLESLKSFLFSINKDLGYAEIYQYVKEFWIVLLVLCVYSKTKEIGYIAWAMLFAYLLFDDAMAIHERVGAIIANKLDLAPAIGLRAKDFGELAASATSAVLLLTLVGLSHSRGSEMFKKINRDFLLLLSVVAFFGVFVDMADIAIKLGSTVNFILVLIEDGGEMIAMSLVAWYAFLLSIRSGHASFSLCNLALAALARQPLYAGSASLHRS